MKDMQESFDKLRSDAADCSSKARALREIGRPFERAGIGDRASCRQGGRGAARVGQPAVRSFVAGYAW
jgi:hypothetical protein